MDRKKIIMVDDSKLVLSMLQEALATLPLNIKSFTNPEQALLELGKTDFDLLILDLDMPKLNGVQFLKAMKENKINLPVMILTGEKDMRLIVQLMAKYSVIKEYLVKTDNDKQIMNSVEKVLKK